MANLTVQAIRVAGTIQLAIIAANVPLPRQLQVRRHLEPVPRFIRQVFYVHWIYIVLVLGLFSGLCLGFSGELAGSSRLGRFLSAFMAGFWVLRVLLQWFYYDREIRRTHRRLDTAYVIALLSLTVIFGWAAVRPA